MQNNNNNNTSNSAKGTTSAGSNPLDQYSMQPSQEDNQSPYYKNAAPSISMPKGGGALKGIDEKFSVNAVNGTAGLEIVLPLSPGRAGFTPALSLNYNSGGGNSAFGLGWSLSLPSIQRKTDKKLPLYQDAEESDVFLLAGAEDLVPELDANGERIEFVSGIYTIKRYRPRIEGLFARIEYIRRQGDRATWWRVTTRDNNTTYYGLSEESRIADPEQAYRIFKWLPSLSLDHKGNVQQYHYLPEDLRNVPHTIYEQNRINGTATFAQTYFKGVRYGNQQPYFVPEGQEFAPPSPTGNWLFEAVLDYGDHDLTDVQPLPNQDWGCRGDAFSDFHAGFEIRTYRRCRRVLMFHSFAELKGGLPTLVHSLDLEWQQSGEEASETDFIREATRTGYVRKMDGTYEGRSLPALKMDYIPFEWYTEIQKVSRENFAGAPQGLTGPYQWTDFEGEGISGILTEQGAGWWYKSNLGDGAFTPPALIAEKPSFAGLGQALQWQDLDADGRRQVVARSPLQGFWELDDEQEWDPFRTFKQNTNIDPNSPFSLMLDLDGDGRPDLLVTEDRAWIWYVNEGKAGFDLGGYAPIAQNEENGPVLLLRDAVQSVFLADINGDGLTDLVRIRNGEICYWPNCGYGRFGAKVTMGNAPVFASPDQFNPLYLSLADISGTGAADLIFTNQYGCKAWINLAGNAWSEVYDLNPLPGTDAYSKIAVLDFLGNGTGCLVWSSPLPQHETAPLQYIDLMGGRKPYLMAFYRNGTGRSVDLSYSSSTQYYLEDKRSGIPWATRLPFPVQCVRRVTISDSVSATEYRQYYQYRHGYYDHEEREYRGFGYVETIDMEATIAQQELDQLPVRTRTWYHTGAWIRENNLLEAFAEEYFRFDGWDQVTQTATMPSGLNAQEQRDAYRALKGAMLRQEVYALDRTAKEGIPYSVTATAYEVKKIQHQAGNRFGVFRNQQQQSVVFSCERDADDPRILHSLTLETDTYGNVLQSAEVAYKRKNIPGSLPAEVRAEQGKMHITCTRNQMTNDAIDQINHRYYRLRLPCITQSFEANVTHASVQEGALWTVALLKAALAQATEVDFSATALNGQKRLLSHARSLFLSDDTTTVLALGELERLALPYQSYQLAFTPGILTACFGSRVNASLLEEGGYVDLDSDGRYWLPSGTMEYITLPATNFYTPENYYDPWGNITKVRFWSSYWLLPESVEDAVDNTHSVESYDWRNLQPSRIKDLNDNITEVLYDVLGMPVAMALKAKDTANEGDRLDDLDPDSAADQLNQEHFWQDPELYAPDLLKDATWRCVYDLNSVPVAVAMMVRQFHSINPIVPPGAEDSPLIRISYSDGLGRILMHKIQAEPTIGNGNKKWIGSGRTVYNNKGSVVLQFEPYFSDTHTCDTAEQAAGQGVSPQMHYDALNRLFHTDLPDGSFTQTQWTSWQQEIWDNNDTVLESTWYADRIGGVMGIEEQKAAEKAAAHANTPTVIHTDTLARGFYTLQQDSQTHTISSYEQLDLQGNRISLVDGRGLTPLSYAYNMLKVSCYQNSIDSGEQRSLSDVGGQPLSTWDAADRQISMTYDVVRRPLKKQITEGSLMRILEIVEYGEGIINDRINNNRGQVYRHSEGSGRRVFANYDFKSNLNYSHQYLLLAPTATDPDWASNPPLETSPYTITTFYDALNRVVKTYDPKNNSSLFYYNKSGALTRRQLNDADVISSIEQNARGQRKAIWYANGTKMSYEYDAKTFRLSRLTTKDTTGLIIHQDLYYYYDPVGNITFVKDEAQQTLFFNNAIVSPDQDYTYDALYRLIEAKGRELKGTADFGTTDNWDDSPWKTSHKGDGNAVQTYRQLYTYDEVGNMLSLQHIATVGSYTRSYAYDNNSNQLLSTTVGSHTYNYSHDARGNMDSMAHLSVMNWNRLNELSGITRGISTANYQYSGGHRVRKWVVKDTITTEERIYLGDFEIYRKFESGSLKVERTTVHISDDTGRIAMQEKRTVGNAADDGGTDTLLTRYIYSNHLQSAALELDENGGVISYEEYHPYGTTSYQATNAAVKAVAKRYRYTGKERDEESGLYYHGARYYVPWLCRWTATDPINSENYNLQKGYGLEKNKERDFLELTASTYEYCYDNPVRFTDPTGEQVPPDRNGLKTITRTEGNITVTEEVPTTSPRPSQPEAPPPPPDASQIMNDTYTGFKNKFVAGDYKGAINVVIDRYRFGDIIHKNLMSTLLQENEMGVSGVFETRGPDYTTGLAQFMELTMGDLLKAFNSKENFSILVIGMAHEYIHGKQRAVQGIKDHNTREFYANQFSVFPNHSIVEREGTVKMDVEFPDAPGSLRFVWAANAIRYYIGLPTNLQESYKEDAKDLLNTGLATYEQMKDRVHPSKKDMVEKLYKQLTDFKIKMNF